MIGHLSVILIYGGIEWADLHASPTYFLGSKWPDSEYARVSIGNVQGLCTGRTRSYDPIPWPREPDFWAITLAIE